MKTILFVDDDAAFLAAISKHFHVLNSNSLNSRPFQIKTAGSAGEAVLALQESAIDVVVTDLQMPVVDGIQFLRVVHGSHPGISKVALTGFADEETRAACFAAGATLFLEKPRTKQDIYLLYASICELLENPTEEEIDGVLPSMQLPELLEVLIQSGNSVTVKIRGNKAEGKIYLRQGALVHAEAGESKGEEAFFQLLEEKAPVVEVESDTHEVPHSIRRGSPLHLLAEAALKADEKAGRKNQEEAQAEKPGEAASEIRFDELLACSREGEILANEGCSEPSHRVDLLELISLKARQIGDRAGLGKFEFLLLQSEDTNCLAVVRKDWAAFASISEMENLEEVFQAIGAKVPERSS